VRPPPTGGYGGWGVFPPVLSRGDNRLLESGMKLTRAKKQNDYVSDSGNKD